MRITPRTSSLIPDNPQKRFTLRTHPLVCEGSKRILCGTTSGCPPPSHRDHQLTCCAAQQRNALIRSESGRFQRGVAQITRFRDLASFPSLCFYLPFPDVSRIVSGWCQETTVRGGAHRPPHNLRISSQSFARSFDGTGPSERKPIAQAGTAAAGATRSDTASRPAKVLVRRWNQPQGGTAVHALPLGSRRFDVRNAMTFDLALAVRGRVGHIQTRWSCGRVAEGTALLKRHTFYRVSRVRIPPAPPFLPILSHGARSATQLRKPRRTAARHGGIENQLPTLLLKRTTTLPNGPRSR